MTLEESLQQLKIGRKAKRLQGMWPTIEERVSAGVSHAEILNLLNANGFALTERTYKSYLYRHRKRRRTVAQNCAPPSLIERPNRQSADGATAIASSAPIELGQHPRPPTFEYDAHGLPRKLLE